MKNLYWRLLPFWIFVFLIVFFWLGLGLDPQKLPSAQLGKSLPNFELPLLGKEKVLTPKTMQGRVVLLNVWASWCESCVQEQTFLMKLFREAIPIYGLDYKDKSEKARHWLDEWGNPYQEVGEDREGKVAIDLGVYGVPETFLIDKEGVIRYRHVGILDENSWRLNFVPRIQELEGKV